MKTKKLIILVLIGFMFTGCSVKYPFVNNTYFTDYRSFTDKGFFITESDAVSFNYDAIGHMSVEMCTGKVVKVSQNGKQSSGRAEKKWGEHIDVTLEMVMEEFYRQAVETGANGSLKLDIKPIIAPRRVDGFMFDMTIGYRISGMLIKIR